MTKNKKTWIVLGSVFGGLGTMALVCTIVLFFYNPFLSTRMVNYYSNDNNFQRYRATIKDYSKKEYGYLLFESIYSLDNDLKAETTYDYAKIFSLDTKKTWNELNPSIGLQIDFVGTFKIFFDGCPAAIVQICLNEKEILKYDEGKTSLIEWAKTIH